MLAVAEYLHFLKGTFGIGIADYFRIQAFNEVVEKSDLKFVNCVNELDSCFAASGYSHVQGLGICANTYGVGSATALGHLNAYTNRLPIVNIMIGAPTGQMNRTRENRILPHHYTDVDYFDYMIDVFQPISHDCLFVDDTNADTAFGDMLDLTISAFTNRLPVLICLPSDVDQVVEVPDIAHPVVPSPAPMTSSEKAQVEDIATIVSDTASVLMVGSKISVHPNSIEDLSSSTGLPIGTFWDSKGLITETHENYFGCHFYAHTPIEDFLVNHIDTVVTIGHQPDEINSVDGTMKLPPNIINWHPRTEAEVILLSNLLSTSQLSSQDTVLPSFRPPIQKEETQRSYVDQTLVYHDISSFFKNNNYEVDYVMDIGDSSFGSSVDYTIVERQRERERGQLLHSKNFCCLGSSVAPGHGVAVALDDLRDRDGPEGNPEEGNPEKVVVVVTGDGGFHLSFTALSAMCEQKEGTNPTNTKIVVFVLDNSGYATTNTFSGQGPYNDVGRWNLDKIPEFFGLEHTGKMRAQKVDGREEMEEALSESMRSEALVSVIQVLLPEKCVSDGMRKYANS